LDCKGEKTIYQWKTKEDQTDIREERKKRELEKGIDSKIQFKVREVERAITRTHMSGGGNGERKGFIHQRGKVKDPEWEKGREIIGLETMCLEIDVGGGFHGRVGKEVTR